MSDHNCCETEDNDCNVTVSVDVTKIVKYACIAGVLIVGIIFGTKKWNKI